jgi:ArsR family transcriptional regulator, arsenate/arsenite/antimonite-responsive transcriptional repressor
MARRTPLEIAAPVASSPLRAGQTSSLETVFKALADVRRLLILNEIAIQDHASVSDLAAQLHTSQSLVSYHVKQLVDAGIVEGHRGGNFTWYSLVDGAFERLAALFATE